MRQIIAPNCRLHGAAQAVHDEQIDLHPWRHRVIGRRVVPQLVASGHRVTAVARGAAGRAALEGLGAIAVDVDLFDRSAVTEAARGQDVVVNMATHVPPSRRALLPWT